jgi:hypothetical protein
MRQFFITLLFLATTACGQAFRSETHYGKDAASSDVPAEIEQPNPQTPTVAIIDAAKATVLSENLTPVLLKMFKAFQDVTKIDYTKASQTVSSSQTIACPQGGSLTAAVTGTLNLSVSLLAASGNVNNGTGTVTFTNCAINTGVVLNGSANILALSANLVASLNANAASTYSVTGNHNLVGNINVTSQNQTQNCALTLADELSSNGTFSLIGRTATGTVTAHLTGTACGHAVNTTKTESF